MMHKHHFNSINFIGKYMSNSWKQYGGTNHLDNTKLGTIIADYLILKNAYNGDLVINGNLTVGNIHAYSIAINYLTVNNDLLINGNIITNKTAIFNGNVDLNGNTFINGSITFNSNLNTNGDLGIGGNINVGNNATILGNIYIPPNFIVSDISGVGINTTPIATLDIQGNNTQSLNVFSNNTSTFNVIAQNNTNKGVKVTANTITSSIQFFNDNAITSSIPDSQIIYNIGGNLEINTANNLTITSKLTVNPSNNSIQHSPLTETATIYDISGNTFLYPIYNNITQNTGNALTLLATDTSSNTFLHIKTPNTFKGFSIGGGVYPSDQSRSMGTLGYTDTSTPFTYNSGQIIIQGNSTIHNTITTGINTYKPITEKYALDINGETRIHNGDLKFKTPPFCVYSMSSYAGNVIAIGGYITANVPPNKYYAYSSVNKGESWNLYSLRTLGDIENTTNFFNNVFYYNATIAFIVGQNGYKGYTNNNGANWTSYTLSYNSSNLPFNATSFYAYTFDSSTVRCFISYNDPITITTPSFYFDVSLNAIYTNTLPTINVTTNTIGTVQQIKAITANSTTLFILSDNVSGLGTFYLYTTPLSNPTTTTTIATYDISLFTPNAIVANDSFLAIGGSNAIYSSRDSGATFTATTTTTINTFANYSATQCVAMGANSAIYYTIDGGINWNTISNDLLNSAGTSGYLINSVFNNINTATFTDNNTLLFNGIETSNIDNSIIYSLYTPNLFNANATNALDISGSVCVSGSLKVNDGGYIDTNNSTFYLLNSPNNTIYFGTNTPYIFIGNLQGKGLTTFNHNATFAGNVSINGNLTITGGSSITVDTSNSGITTFTNITDSTALRTGSVIVYGGASIDGNLFLGGNLITYGNSYVGGEFYVKGNTVNNKNLYVNNSITVGSSAPFSPPNYKLAVIGNANITTTLSVNGNVAIGKLNPSFTLDVSGIVNSTGLYVNGTPYIGSQWTTSSTNIYYISGNVGVGTTTPLYTLDVSGNQRITGNSIFGGTVGIGKTNPSFTLDVSGIVNSTGLYVNGTPYIGSQWTTSSPNIYFISGNVGIGTTTPQYTMDVNGNARINSIIIGNIGTQLTGIDLGSTDGTRDSNAGKIMYGPTTINGNSLVIIGKGTASTNRNIDLYDNVTINGNLTVNNAINAFTTKTFSGGQHTGLVVQKVSTQSSAFNLSLITVDASNNGAVKRVLGFNSYANLNANNGITKAGDHQIVYADDISTQIPSSCGLTIAPFDTAISGMRLDSQGFMGICKSATTYDAPLDVGKSAGGPSGIQTRTLQGIEYLNSQKVLHIIQPVTSGTPASADITYYNTSGTNILDISAGVSVGWSTQTPTGLNTGTTDFLNWGYTYAGGFTFHTINKTPNFTPKILMYMDASGNKTTINVNKYPNYSEVTNYVPILDVSGSSRFVQDCSSLIVKCSTRASAQSAGTRIIFDTDGLSGGSIFSAPFTYISAIQDASNSATLNFATNNSRRMTILNNGLIGIGTTTPAYNLDINGSINATSYYINGSPFSFISSQWTTLSANIYYNTGNVAIGKSTNPLYTLDVNGNIFASVNMIANGTVSATSFNATSDYRIKENPIKIDINKYNLNKLNPISYRNLKSNKLDFGLIAHEVQTIFPSLVTGIKDDDNNLQSVNYIALIPILIKEIQEIKYTLYYYKIAIIVLLIYQLYVYIMAQ